MDVTALYEAAAAGADDTSVQITGLPETESQTDPGMNSCHVNMMVPVRCLHNLQNNFQLLKPDHFIAYYI